MGDPRGFLQIKRTKPAARPVSERLGDFHEFDHPLPDDGIRAQAARCMDCGIPFCHQGCPLGNLIPEWNELVRAGRWDAASQALHATNNFPEVTGRVCPAPCEASCVLNLDNIPEEDGRRVAPGAVSIKQIERQIADRSVDAGGLVPRMAPVRSGRRVAIVGSGPAGLACAQQLARKGHDVTVFERDDRVGGLLRYGIPDFKLEKGVIDRRVEQMQREGVRFRTRVHVGVDVTAAQLRAQYEAVVLCGGAPVPRPLEVPGAELAGVHPAMAFLTQQNRRNAGDRIDAAVAIDARDRHVVVLGGGDTGSDCVGTSLRQGARSVRSLEIAPRPPEVRSDANPWPEWPLVYRTSSSHEEGGERSFGVMTKRVLGDEHGRVRALEVVRVEREGNRFVEQPGSAFEIPCDLLLLAMGFVGSARGGLFAQFGIELDPRGNVPAHRFATVHAGVFTAGDARRGQSLVVWAIAEGRQAAERVHAYLATVPV